MQYVYTSYTQLEKQGFFTNFKNPLLQFVEIRFPKILKILKICIIDLRRMAIWNL